MKKDADWDDVIKLWEYGRPISTLEKYRPVVAHFRNFVQQTPLNKIELTHLQTYMDLWKKLKPASVHWKMSAICSLLKFAHRLGVIAVNPATMLRLPKVPDDLAKRIFPVAEIQKLIAAEPDNRNKVMISLIYCTGIRTSECSGLRWTDCRERGKFGQITVLGKRLKKRSIKINPDIWKMLCEMRPPQARDADYVFVSPDGVRPIHRTRISHIVADAARRVGLEHRICAHALRHCHATHAMDAGAPLPLISATLGHASIQTTARYLHANPDKSSGEFIKLRPAG
jgi:integrase/recombinase XerD